MSWRARIQMQLGTLHLDVDVSGDDAPVALIGPNGAGKSTILRTIAGAHTPETGLITVGDTVLLDTDAGVVRPPEERGVGYVPQGYALFPHLSVLDNVGFGVSGHRDARRAKALTLLEDLDAGALATLPIASLSSGELQRVALARALIMSPSILLLDEPLSAMDAPARRVMRTRLAERLRVQGTSGLVVTHDARDVRALDALIYVIEGGRVVQQGNAESLTEEPATEFVAEFFDSASPNATP
jgi:molybdate transport system ATP-binding protein